MSTLGENTKLEVLRAALEEGRNSPIVENFSMDKVIEEVRIEANEQEKQQLLLAIQGDILNQLLQHDRFQMFLTANYKVEYHQDDEAQQVGFKVTEISNEDSMKMIKEAMEQAKKEEIVVVDENALKEMEKKHPPRWGKRRVK